MTILGREFGAAGLNCIYRRDAEDATRGRPIKVRFAWHDCVRIANHSIDSLCLCVLRVSALMQFKTHPRTRSMKVVPLPPFELVPCLELAKHIAPQVHHRLFHL